MVALFCIQKHFNLLVVNFVCHVGQVKFASYCHIFFKLKISTIAGPHYTLKMANINVAEFSFFPSSFCISKDKIFLSGVRLGR